MASQALEFLKGNWVNVENPSETYEVTGRTVHRSSTKQGDRSFPDILVWEEKWQKLYWGPKGRYYLESPIPQGDKISWLAWGSGKGFQWERRRDGTWDKQSKDQFSIWGGGGGRSAGDEKKSPQPHSFAPPPAPKVVKDQDKDHKATDYWEKDHRDGEQNHKDKDYWERDRRDKDKKHKDKDYWERDRRDTEATHKDKDYWERDHRDKAPPKVITRAERLARYPDPPKIVPADPIKAPPAASSSSSWVAHTEPEQPKDSSSPAVESSNGHSKAEDSPGWASSASTPPRNYLGLEPGNQDHERLIARSLLADGFRPKPDQEDADAPPAKRAKESSSSEL